MPSACTACKHGIQQPMPFSMAFQPIVDVEANRVFAFEALVRGPQNESAYSVLSQVTEQNRYSFDQSCRVRAINLAVQLGLAQTGARLSINFIPGAVYSPAACIQLTLKTDQQLRFPLDRLIFEITEGEQVNDPAHLQSIAGEYRRHGFRVALDDFGAGYSHLNLLATLPVDIIKLDMALTRDLHNRPQAQHIVRGMATISRNLGSTLIAEGIETVEEYEAVRACGITHMQGYLLARPAFEVLPEYVLPHPPAEQARPSRQSSAWFPMVQPLHAM